MSSYASDFDFIEEESGARRRPSISTDAFTKYLDSNAAVRASSAAR